MNTIKHLWPEVAAERILPDGRLAAVIPQLYNSILITDIDRHGYNERW